MTTSFCFQPTYNSQLIHMHRQRINDRRQLLTQTLKVFSVDSQPD
jgi:hypothetical protein